MPQLFVPTTGGGNGWAQGLGTMAEAFAAAPGNRMRVRQMEMEMARQASQDAIEKKRLQLAEEAAVRDAAAALLGNDLTRQTIGQNKIMFPLAADQARQGLRTGDQTYHQAEIMNPLVADATRLDNTSKGIANKTAQIGANRAQMSLDAVSPAAGGMAEAVMRNVRTADPLKLDLSPRALPVPGPEGQDYPQFMNAEPQLAAHDDIEKYVRDLSASAALHEGTDQAKWVKDTSEQVISGIPGAASASETGVFPDGSVPGAALNIAQAYNLKKKQPGAQTTAAEDTAYALAYDQLWGKKKSFFKGPDGYDHVTETQDQAPSWAVPPPQIGGVPVSQTPDTGVSGQAVGTVGDASSASDMSAPSGVYPAPEIANTPAMAVATAGGTQTNKPDFATPDQNKTIYQDAVVDTAFNQFASQIGYDRKTGVYDPSKGNWKNISAVRLAIYRQVPDMWKDLAVTRLTPEEQQYLGATASLLNQTLRYESGAAVPEQEYPRYIMSLIPLPGESAESVRDKLQRLEAVSKAFRTMKEPVNSVEVNRNKALLQDLINGQITLAPQAPEAVSGTPAVTPETPAAQVPAQVPAQVAAPDPNRLPPAVPGAERQLPAGQLPAPVIPEGYEPDNITNAIDRLRENPTDDMREAFDELYAAKGTTAKQVLGY